MTEAELALAELAMLATEDAKIRKQLASIAAAEKRQRGRYLVACGWRKVENGWLEPGRPMADRRSVFGLLAAFMVETKRRKVD